MSRRVEFGDWQTPLELSRAVIAHLAKIGVPKPSAVFEPTCGEGSFLVAAAERYPSARLRGYEINEDHVATARANLGRVARASEVTLADFFRVDWDRELAMTEGHLLVTGNPPWVTNSIQGSLGASNLPGKSNFKRHSGLDALTGKSNFDVSEWMMVRLLQSMVGRSATLAVLCKTAVARRVVEYASAKRWELRPHGLWRIDASRHFDASVDAVLFVCGTGPSEGRRRWPVFSSLDEEHPVSTMEIVDGVLAADADKVAKTAHLVGHCQPEWRSGLKHDCSRVMELTRGAEEWLNGERVRVDVEPAYVYPFLKSSDVARIAAGGVAKSARGVIVSQRKIGEETSTLRERAPKLWRYLVDHQDALEARKSAIYRNQPKFAIFGVGPYSFAKWKVAISGLYKNCAFALVPPSGGRPVLMDDTCYFLPFDDEQSARRAYQALCSPLAAEFFASRVFLDAKRPISKGILQKLDLSALEAELGLRPRLAGKPVQPCLALGEMAERRVAPR